jgi:hypothetical protein
MWWRAGRLKMRGARHCPPRPVVMVLWMVSSPGSEAQASKTSNPAMAKPATSNDQSPKSKPSRRPPVAMRTLTEPSDIVLLLGPDTKRSDTSRGLVEGDGVEVQWNTALPPSEAKPRNEGGPNWSVGTTFRRFSGRPPSPSVLLGASPMQSSLPARPPLPSRVTCQADRN